MFSSTGVSIVLKDVGEYRDHIVNWLTVTGKFKRDIQVLHLVSTCLEHVPMYLYQDVGFDYL